MRFYNGVPIAVVSVMPSVSMPTDSQSRRSIDEKKSPQTMKSSVLRCKPIPDCVTS